jgi:hypothetical protein
MKRRVYISSTYKDLKVYREAVIKMFASKGLLFNYELVSMEGYVAESGMRSLDICLKDVRSADIYLLVLAKNYGSLIEGQNISYTEAEYNEALACRQKNPNYMIFVYYSDAQLEDKDFEGSTLKNENLVNFYTKARHDNAGFITPFTNPDNLCVQILLTFQYYFEKPQSISDFKDAMLLIDRKTQAYNFSLERKINQANSFFFSALERDNPDDFIERISSIELGGIYERCDIDMTSVTAYGVNKMEIAFKSLLPSALKDGKGGYSFNFEDKLLINLYINSQQLRENEALTGKLIDLLAGFLPNYLYREGEPGPSRLFCLYFAYRETDPGGTDGFDQFVDQLNVRLEPAANRLTDLFMLPVVVKGDVREWFSTFVHGGPKLTNDLDSLLLAANEPDRKLRMNEVIRLLSTWLENNALKTNSHDTTT